MSQGTRGSIPRFSIWRESQTGFARRVLYIVSPLCVAAAVLLTWLFAGDWLWSPGPLSSGHAMLQRDCAQCHASPGAGLVASERARDVSQANRACLRCHKATIGASPKTFTATHHERAASDGRPCTHCHIEHRGQRLSLVASESCIGCHRDLGPMQSDGKVSTHIAAFARGDRAGDSAASLHPEFRILAEKRADAGILAFNHQRHLFGGAILGPQGRPVALSCQDCHRATGQGPFRFGRGHDAREPSRAAAARRGDHMAPIAFSAHCAGCHPLMLIGHAATLVGNDAVDRGHVPHATPAAIRGYLRGQLAASSLSSAAAEAELSAIEGQLYGDASHPSPLCGACHTLKREGVEHGELPVVVPTALPTRFLPRATFSHAKHTAASRGSYGSLSLPAESADCLGCHSRAADSRLTSDVLMPSIEECRRCHAPPSGTGAAARGGVSDRCSMCHTYHVPPPQALGPTPIADGAAEDTPPPSLVEAGQREVRHGLRTSTPLWPLSAFFELPHKVWGLPDVTPQSPRFQAEVFRRYGLFPADRENDGLPLGLIKTERTWKGQPGLTVTCEYCHSSSLFGQIVVGQPNPFADMEQLWIDLDAVSNGQGKDPLYEKTPAGNTVVNGADHLGLLGLYYRNSDLTASLGKAARWLLSSGLADRPAQMKAEFDALAYIKTPPWYTYATRKSGACGLYADGGQPKYGNFAAFTYLLTYRDLDGQDLATALAAWKRSAPAFLASLSSPRYPFSVRSSLLPRGRALFDATCARCHGRYAATDSSPTGLSYPGLVFPLAEIGTDPKRAHFPPSFTARIQSILNEQYTITGGYAAPPLTAIWSRAPYLHNGSVPTLAELLDPPSRRARYVLAANPNARADFDHQRVGWRVEVPPPGATPATVHRLYDAAFVEGLANTGHTYGAELSPDDREALLEFLKTL